MFVNTEYHYRPVRLSQFSFVDSTIMEQKPVTLPHVKSDRLLKKMPLYCFPGDKLVLNFEATHI